MITLKLRRDSGKAATRRTDPNDTNCVIWAISTSFFFFFSCFYIYANHLIGSNGIIKLRRYLREVTMKRTGPNDAIRVVWAISKCIFLFFVFFNHSKSFPWVLLLMWRHGWIYRSSTFLSPRSSDQN